MEATPAVRVAVPRGVRPGGFTKAARSPPRWRLRQARHALEASCMPHPPLHIPPSECEHRMQRRRGASQSGLGSTWRSLTTRIDVTLTQALLKAVLERGPADVLGLLPKNATIGKSQRQD